EEDKGSVRSAASFPLIRRGMPGRGEAWVIATPFAGAGAWSLLEWGKRAESSALSVVAEETSGGEGGSVVETVRGGWTMMPRLDRDDDEETTKVAAQSLRCSTGLCPSRVLRRRVRRPSARTARSAERTGGRLRCRCH